MAPGARLAAERSEPEEGLEPVLVDLREIAGLLRSSELDHALHVAALMLALAGGHLPGLFAS